MILWQQKRQLDALTDKKHHLVCFFNFFSLIFIYFFILEIFKIIGQKPPEQIPVKGYKTETPIWMAEMLCTKNVFHVQVGFIQFFQDL